MKKQTLFLLALLPLLMLGLFQVVPRIDPRGKSYEKHQKVYGVFNRRIHGVNLLLHNCPGYAILIINIWRVFAG